MTITADEGLAFGKKIMEASQRVKEAEARLQEAREDLTALLMRYANSPGVARVEAFDISNGTTISWPTPTIDERIVNTLDSNCGTIFSTEGVADKTGIPLTSLGTQLSKLARSGRIKRLRRGVYVSNYWKPQPGGIVETLGIQEEHTESEDPEEGLLQ